MLNIIVLGEGLIPRSRGIAPRKDPFQADMSLIKLCLTTGGLEPYFINPETNKPVRLTMTNYEKMYAKFSDYVKPMKEEPKAQTAPYVKPAQQPSQPIKTVVVNNTPVEEKKEEVTEEKKDDDMKIAPIGNDSNNNNNGNKNNNNNNNHKK